MKKLYLSFLWHMHQPYYKNPLTKQYEMPWVFLHAIKDYYEMPWYLSNFTKIKATFNLVPSLIVQLLEYVKGEANCKFLKTVEKPVHQLSQKEKTYLIEMLFFANLKTMIFPFPRYYELFNKYERIKENLKLENEQGKVFSETEILDLEVLFLLAWTGNSFREKSKFISELIKKGVGYTQQEKLKLIDELNNLIKDIIPFYEELEAKKRISISTTPFYHPIIPLLIDIKSAKESTPDVSLPKVYADFYTDAKRHIYSAISYYDKIFLKKPNGFWPSEGSISNETLNLFSENGIKWTASDEEVLFNSLEQPRNRMDIYKQYIYKDKIKLYFRDKILSDLIGFTYADWNPEKAAEDFIGRLKTIYNECSFSPLVSVILDGENAWEFYYNNGKDFFFELYSKLEKEEWIETITFDEIEQLEDIQTSNINNIVAGSWIGGNFLTWVGHPEKNKAWELLSQTKIFLNSQNLPQDKRKEAEDYLCIAEGSDWFWWYGDDHYSDFADKFDMLFRANLMEIYAIAGEKIPDELLKPIKKSYKKAIIRHPNYYIHPIIDGNISNYFEWLNAGIIDLQFDASTMDTSNIHLKEMYYGYDKENFYFLLKGNFKHIIDKGYYLGIDIALSDKKIHIRVPISKENKDIKLKDFQCEGIDYAINQVIEFKIPLKCIEKNMELNFKIFKEDKVIEKIPFYNFIHLDLTKNFDYEWYV